MIAYRKDEIEALARAASRHWGGQPLDWRLIIETSRHNPPPSIILNVEIALDGSTRISTIPLDKPVDASSCFTAPASARGHPTAVAAVRRRSVQALLTHSTDGDIEPLLSYLRCCGILVTD